MSFKQNLTQTDRTASNVSQGRNVDVNSGEKSERAMLQKDVILQGKRYLVGLFREAVL
jgi:hypothetical protein